MTNNIHFSYKNIILSGLVAMGVFIGATLQANAATLTVNSTLDTAADDGFCTLREAILAVNNTVASGAATGECVAGDGSNDIINLPTGTITLGSDLDPITEPVSIVGQGIGQTTLNGNNGQYTGLQNMSSINTPLVVRALTITAYRQEAIAAINSALTVRQVEIDGNGSLNSVGFLAGISHLGTDRTLIIEDTYVHSLSSNTAPAVFGIVVAVSNSQPSDVTIRRSTIEDVNGGESAFATGGIGLLAGLIDQSGNPGSINAIVENTTIYNIRSQGDPSSSSAASFILSSSLNGGENIFSLTLSNNTFSAVSHPATGGSLLIFSDTTNSEASTEVNATFSNNILSTGTFLNSCSFATAGIGQTNFNVISEGGNYSEGNSCSTAFTDSADMNNVTGIPTTLGPVANNGGYVPTMALLDGSPALNGGVTVAGLTTDARGITRPQGTAYDSGAYEREVASVSPSALLASTGQTLVIFAGIGLGLVGLSGFALLKLRRR